MTSKPDKAFILAAGKGTRLRPYTDTIPKPMVEIAGKSIIRRAIEKLAAEGVSQVVVNLHHLSPVLQKHLQDIKSPEIIFSHEEEELLDTGGGLKKAIHHFGNDPFYILNGDALWDDKKPSALARLAGAWNAGRMDILLLLQPVSNMNIGGVGDYYMENGKARRAKDKGGTHMFAGIRIANPKIFEAAPDGAFSFLTLMDKAESAGRLYAIEHDDAWYHISTPEDLEAVNKIFAERG